MTKAEAIDILLQFIRSRYGHGLHPEEEMFFAQFVCGILLDAIDHESYQSLRRRLDYRQTFTLN